MVDPKQHFLQTPQLRLSYWTWGSDAAPPLVLVHGQFDHARTWDRLAETLASDYRVYAYDLRGHGDSDWGVGATYGATELLIDLVEVLDLTAQPVRVVAHSVGATTALIAAACFPERIERIVTIEDAGPRIDDVFARHPRERLVRWVERMQALAGRSPRVYASLAEAAERMQAANPRRSAELVEHLTRWGARPADGGVSWKFDPRVGGMPGVDVTGSDFEQIWSSVQCPVLHLVGEQSDWKRTEFRERPIDSYFADARTIVVAGAGHEVHHDRFDETVAAIREFFAAGQ